MDGAKAMLKLRAVFLDELWDNSWAFRPQNEKAGLYSLYAGISQPDQAVSKPKTAAWLRVTTKPRCTA